MFYLVEFSGESAFRWITGFSSIQQRKQKIHFKYVHNFHCLATNHKFNLNHVIHHHATTFNLKQFLKTKKKHLIKVIS